MATDQDKEPNKDAPAPNTAQNQPQTGAPSAYSNAYASLYQEKPRKVTKQFKNPGIGVNYSTLLNHIILNGGQKDLYEEVNFPQGLVIDIVKDLDISKYAGGSAFTTPITAYRIVPVDRIPSNTSNLEFLKIYSRLFYPPTNGFGETFAIGDIVRISYPKDYPANKNELDNRYFEKSASNANGTMQQAPNPADLQAALNSVTLAAGTNAAPAPANASFPVNDELKKDYVNGETAEILKNLKPEEFLNPATKAPYIMTSPVTTARVDPAPPAGKPATVQGHAGVDIAYNGAIPLYAGADGTMYIGSGGGGGNGVTITHRLFKTYHGHMRAWATVGPDGKPIIYTDFAQASKALNGKTVKAGDLIGFMGNTGTHSSGQHLHWQFKSIKNDSPNNIIYFMRKYAYQAGSSVKSKYKLSTNIIGVPFSNVSTAGSTNPPNNSSEAPKPEDKSAEKQGDTKQTKSPPRNRPTLNFIKFKSDFSPNANSLLVRGSPDILIREDINDYLLEIKQILNKFSIALPLQSAPLSINMQNSNILEMCGLSVKIPETSGLHPDNCLKNDFFLSYKESEETFNYKKLTIWAKANVGFNDYKGFSIYKGSVPALNIQKSYKKRSKPEEEIIFGSFLNITSIFKAYNFISSNCQFEFTNNSNYKVSNWNTFYNISTLKKNITTAGEVLESVYLNKNEKIWLQKNNIWNGETFIGSKNGR